METVGIYEWKVFTLLVRLTKHWLQLHRDVRPEPKEESTRYNTNYILEWCSSSDDLGSIKYPFILIASMPTMTQISSTF